jgi:hypothetical protein
MNAFTAAGLITAVVALLGGIAYWSYQARKRRGEALQQLANEMRWTFSPQGDDTLRTTFGAFKLFSTGHSKRLDNVLRGTAQETSAAFFDYQYTTGAGKSRHTSRHTVLWLGLGGRPLPHFFLRPEHLFDKMADWMGYKDIDFENYPEFSKRYLLRGENEHEIRRLFGPRLIELLEKESGLCMEGDAGNLILYRQRGRLKVDEMRSFLQKGLQVASLMRQER